jgi:SAM-dependent methyltransferase
MYCSACGKYSRRFLPYGGRRAALCPQCGALERHRFLAAKFLAQPGRTLDVGVSRDFFRKLVVARGGTYTGVDVVPRPEVDLVADVTALPFEDEVFDTLLCSHVLEHVTDDRAAVRELARVLTPEGTCLIMFPHDETRAETFEDPSVVTAADRERVYGQRDHVRIYGRDRLDRLQPPFSVQTVPVDASSEVLYLCTHPVAD